MPTRVRLFFSIFSVALFLIATAPLYRELSRAKDIWWTPHTMLVPLPRSQDRVEIYLRGKPLATLIEAGQLRLFILVATGRLTYRDDQGVHNSLGRAPRSRG